MRDPERIKPMLDMVRTVWRRDPDMRLGQMLMNCEEGDDLYFIEDEELFRRLDKLYRINHLEPPMPPLKTKRS